MLNINGYPNAPINLNQFIVRSFHSFRCWTEINLNALTFNFRRIRSLRKNSPVIVVVKADAYGHGLFAVAQQLAGEGVQTMAVANLREADVASRAAPRADILLLSPLLPEEMEEVVRHPKWISTICHRTEYEKLEKAAARLKRKVRVHLKLDTGMGRLGDFAVGLFPLVQQVHSSRWLVLDGLYSHLASADTDPDESLRQLVTFEIFCRQVALAGIHVPKVHFENSAGSIFWGGDQRISDLDRGLRPGLALYGVPVPLDAWRKRFGSHPLRPVLSWRTRVALVREMPAGSTISYGNTFRARRRMRVAVLSAGYADGISRKLSNPCPPPGRRGGEVLIHGKRRRILGRVTMDMVMVDVTRAPQTRWGDTATLIGKDGRDEITASEFAEWAETNPYEVLCNISKRVPRIPTR